MVEDSIAQSDAWRTRPLFISSTFRDMHAERDLLANEILPELAEQFRPLRIHIEPIDLRVGVETLSSADEGKKQLIVLKVCLDDIERSRPFMIVLLGDRYGWVPPPDRMVAAIREKGFETEIEGKSVTALEIEFGILNSRDQINRSFFYLRDPLPYDRMPPRIAAIYSDAHDDDPAAAGACQNLQALKTRIKAQCPARFRNYRVGWDEVAQRVTGLGELRAMILKDLAGEIANEARAIANQPPPSELEDFIEQRCHGFFGRVDTLAALRAFALEPDREGGNWGLCLTGEAGAGKSAVFARFCRDLAGDDLLLLTHAAGVDPTSTLVEPMLRNWIDQLAHAIGVPNPIAWIESEVVGEFGEKRNRCATTEEIEQAFALLLHRAATARRVVLLVDALNQFEPTPRAQKVTWLPRPWPANVRLIATAIPGAASEALDERAGVRTEELPALGEADARGIAESVYSRYHRTPNPEVVSVLLDKRLPDGRSAAANPLWLHLATEELNLLDADDFARADRQFSGSPEDRLHQMVFDVARRLPAGVTELFGWMLDRAAKLHGRQWTDAFAMLLAVGRAGWREADFRDLIPSIAGVTWDNLHFAALRRSFRGQVVRRGLQEQWVFTHDQFRAAAHVRYFTDPVEEKHLHGHVADYLEALPSDDPVRVNSLMFHYIGADAKLRAARYYGSLNVGWSGQTFGSTYTLAQHIIAHQPSSDSPQHADVCTKDFGPGLDWVLSLLDEPGLKPDEQAGLCHNFQFSLLNALENATRLPLRHAILLRVSKVIQELCETDPLNPSFKYCLAVNQSKIGDMFGLQGNLAEAYQSYRSAMAIAEQLATADPASAQWQKDICIRQGKIGDVLRIQGKHVEALTAFRSILTISERMLNEDPDHATDWLRGIAVALNKIGFIQHIQGNLVEAINSYIAALKIAKDLVAHDPSCAQWQRDLSVNHNLIGDLYFENGNLSAAMIAYNALRDIAERMAAQDPLNTQLQQTLSCSYAKIGDILSAQGKFTEALVVYNRSHKIHENLASQDPSNTEWQRELALYQNKVGGALLKLGNLKEARAAFIASLTIIKHCAQLDPANAQWQHDLAANYNDLGAVLSAQKDLDGALAAHRKSLEIVHMLVDQYPTDSRMKRALAIYHINVGDTLLEQGNHNEALTLFQSALEIQSRMAAHNSENVQWQLDIAMSLRKIGQVLHDQGNLTEAMTAYSKSHSIYERMAIQSPDNIQVQRDYVLICSLLAGVSAELSDPQEREWMRRAFNTLSAMKAKGMSLSEGEEKIYCRLEETLCTKQIPFASATDRIDPIDDPGRNSDASNDMESIDDEDLYQMVLKLVLETRKASVSFIARQLKIGYARAGRMMDILEERGIVGPYQGYKPRELLVDPDTFLSLISDSKGYQIEPSANSNRACDREMNDSDTDSLTPGNMEPVDEDLYQKALKLVLESRNASVSLIQRRLKIGYLQAGRLMDMMEKRDIVGPYHGSKARDLLVDPDVFLASELVIDEVQENHPHQSIDRHQTRDLGADKLRNLAERNIHKEQWKAAEMLLLKLQSQGEPIEWVGPRLATCILNKFSVLSPAHIDKLNTLANQLRLAGQPDFAREILERLEQKQRAARPAKPFWKFWG